MKIPIQKANRTRQYVIWIPCLMIILAILACVGNQNLGVLPISSTPTIFTLRGEVDNTWQVNLTPNQQYEIIIKSQKTNHPIDELDVWVQEGSGNLASPITFSKSTATTHFTA